jgi:hypothetical protein
MSEDLRQYALEKEEAMKARVEAYRLQKEEELKKLIGQKVLEVELKELVVKRIREGKSDPIESFENDFDALISRMEEKVQCLPKPENLAPQKLGLDAETKVKDFIDKARYQRECALLKKNEMLVNLMDEISTNPINENILRNGINQSVLLKIDSLEAHIRNTIKDQTERDQDAVCHLQNDVSAIVEKKIESALNAINFDFEKFHTVMSEMPDEDDMLSYRRRLLIAIEKRITDLISGHEEMKRIEIQKVVNEYKSELEQLFIRYIQALSFSKRSERSNFSKTKNESVIRHVWDEYQVPPKDRIKFIQLVTERYHEDPALINILNWYISSS